MKVKTIMDILKIEYIKNKRIFTFKTNAIPSFYFTIINVIEIF